MEITKSLPENSKSNIHVYFMHCYDKMLLHFSKSLVKPTTHTVIAAMKLKDTCSLEESYGQPREHIQKQRHYFVD